MAIRSFLLLVLVAGCSRKTAPVEAPASGTLAPAAEAPSEGAQWDRIVVPAVFMVGLTGPASLDFERQHEDGVYLYVSSQDLPEGTDAHDHNLCSVAVGPAGRFLTEEAVETFRARLVADETVSEVQVASQLPDIGRRAMVDAVGFGPGGAAYGLTFTTSDGRYDVRVTVSNRLPEGVDGVAFDPEAVARQVSQRYDAATAQ